MKLYLDTNILVYILLKREDDIHRDVHALLSDYSNTLSTSSICVAELIHLFQIGKVTWGRKNNHQTSHRLVENLKDMNIEIVPITEQHLQAYDALPLHEEHRDPNDRQIIAQAIKDKAVLVSSDHKFSAYSVYGLNFVFNKR